MQLQSVVAKTIGAAVDYKAAQQARPNQQTTSSVELQKNNKQPEKTPTSIATGQNEKAIEEKNESTKVKLENTVEALNTFLKPTSTSIQFMVHEKTSDYFVQVVNRENGEVIREIPSEEMLDLRYAFEKYLGLLIDKKI